MKKVLIMGVILGSITSYGATDTYWNLKLGTEFAGQYAEISNNEFTIPKDTDNFGGVVSLEYMKVVNSGLDIGIGVAYQQHADRKETVANVHYWASSTVAGVTYASIPIYGVAKIKLPTTGHIKPYIIGHAGYSFNINAESDWAFNGNGYWDYEFNPSIKNGAYTGIGVGMEYKNFTFDVMYQMNYAKDDNGNNMDYKRGVALIGLKF